MNLPRTRHRQTAKGPLTGLLAPGNRYQAFLNQTDDPVGLPLAETREFIDGDRCIVIDQQGRVHGD